MELGKGGIKSYSPDDRYPQPYFSKPTGELLFSVPICKYYHYSRTLTKKGFLDPKVYVYFGSSWKRKRDFRIKVFLSTFLRGKSSLNSVRLEILDFLSVTENS